MRSMPLPNESTSQDVAEGFSMFFTSKIDKIRDILDDPHEMPNLLFLHKCIHGLYDINIGNYVQFVGENKTVNTRSADDILKLVIQYSKTETGKNLYFHRVTSIWNTLPLDVRQDSNALTVKKKIKEY
eukprot:GHVU01176612.1.p1 GENE.GHVU01176612.1~~GHVU01176612.1.p1  ORF type:complete len:139 (-),score=9.15 GHVU01176612.1:887-1270(-)